MFQRPARLVETEQMLERASVEKSQAGLVHDMGSLDFHDAV